MPKFQRHARADEIGAGHFKFLNTGVIVGDDGIKGLKKYTPIAQTEWLHDGTANHAKTDVYDAGTGRIMTRITSAAGGAITSRMRKRVLLSRDFWKFFSGGFEMIVRGNAGTLPTAYTMTVERNATPDSVVNDYSIKPSVAATFEQKLLSITDTTYLAHELVTLIVKLTTANAGEWCEIGDVGLAYVTRRGNI